MLETALIGLFCAALFVSVAAGWSLIPAMVGGLALFLGYGLLRHHRLMAMLRRAVASMRAAGMVIGTFVLISLLTSLWRGSGTIAFIVAAASRVIHPSTVVPLSFLLCSGMSVLVGSSFATVATMGTICMSLGLSMGASPVWLGGAILAGVYVGDRCSPVSTSAQLVAQVTRTNMFDNLGRMVRTGAAPFALSCAVYAAVAAAYAWLPGFAGVGAGAGGIGAGTDASAVASSASAPLDIPSTLATAFNLSWLTVIPAALVLVLAAARVDVRITLLAGIISSMIICVGVQHTAWPQLARMMLFGYAAPNARVAALLDGGGVVSMLNVMVIVMISSAYAGIFAETRMLAGVQSMIAAMGRRIGAFAATLVIAASTVALSCNQTLAIMLTQQLGEGLYGAADSGARATGEDTAPDRVGRIAQAIDLEDTVVVVAPLVPWCIAGAVPLAIIGAPVASLPAATFLYLLPLCRLIGGAVRPGVSGRP